VSEDCKTQFQLTPNTCSVICKEFFLLHLDNCSKASKTVEGKRKVTKPPVKAKEQMIDALLPQVDLGKLSSALPLMQHQRSTSIVNA
jgi:hypothetical protein